MIINELIASPRTDAELNTWLCENKFNRQTAINFSLWDEPKEQQDTYYRLYEMAKSMPEAPTPINPATAEYVKAICSGDSYFDEIG